MLPNGQISSFKISDEGREEREERQERVPDCSRLLTSHTHQSGFKHLKYFLRKVKYFIYFYKNILPRKSKNAEFLVALE